MKLTETEIGWITDWCRQAPGRAVWKVGEWTYKVETILHPLERQHLAFTSQNLLGAR